MNIPGSELMKQYYNKTKFVSHQIDSFNHFITTALHQIIMKENSNIDYLDEELVNSNEYSVHFSQIYVDSPRISERTLDLMYPNDARIKNMTYDGTIYTTIKVIYKNKETVYPQISIGKIPIMIGSCICNVNDKIESFECENDNGGYFILKGKERVLVGQVRKSYNKVYVDEINDDKFKYVAELRSTNFKGSVLVQLKLNVNTSELVFSLPFIKIKSVLYAGIVFKALNVSKEQMLTFSFVENETIKFILCKQYDLYSDSRTIFTMIAEEMNKSIEFVEKIFLELFYHIPNLSTEDTAIHLGYMIKKILETCDKKRAIDDKNNLANKRLDGTCSLLGFLFTIAFRQMLRSLYIQLNKKNSDLLQIIKSLTNITQIFRHAFMTGQWNLQKSSSYTRVGVSQVLSVQNYGAKLSHLRRIMLPIGNKGKNIQCRYLHGSHFSFICPFETPEGETVGIVSNLAASVILCNEVDSQLVENVIYAMKSFSKIFRDRDTLVLLNGRIIGCCDMYKFLQEFEEYRKTNLIHQFVSVVRLRDENEIHIQTDDGRLMRPLFKIGDRNKILWKNNPHFTWDQHVDHGSIVFREVWELEQSVVAMNEQDLQENRCDYLEICPAMTVMGVMASAINLSNHSQAPRIAYQSAMGKQAIGVPMLSYQYRFDTTLNVLDIPQKPISQSIMVNVMKFDEMSHGANPVIAIMTHKGFNQEDSIILNKASLDRGLFSATTYKTIVEEEKKRCSTEFETIGLVEAKYRNKNYNYSFVGESGIINTRNVFLKKGTVIVSRTSHRMIKHEDERIMEMTDNSTIIHQGEEGYLDWVIDTVNNEGVRIIKIRIRIPRKVEIGDKFSSSTAQKGTCGMIFAQEDLPFTKDGLVPDLIINPHAIPSRMTINMLIEMAFNLIGCSLYKIMDTTPFHHSNIEQELDDWLKKTNIESFASRLYDGCTGRIFPSRVFMAPCFYQRLKHMVSDKIHSRITGPLDILTHQPVAGRSRDGGLRFGEMEKDCMLSHGSTRILKECLFDKSDKYCIPICTLCSNIPDKRTYCSLCENSDIEHKTMPYATKLLCQELQGMGIKLNVN